MTSISPPRRPLLKRLYVLERQLDLFGFAPWERDALMARDFSRGGRRGKAAGGAAAAGGLHAAAAAPGVAAPVVNTGRTCK